MKRRKMRVGPLSPPAIRTDRKPCARPACGQMIPLSWTYCRNRACQSDRTHLPQHRDYLTARLQREQQWANRARRAWASRKAEADKNWERRRRVFLDEENRALQAALATRSDLAELIAEQEADERRTYLGTRGQVSLDAALWVSDDEDTPSLYQRHTFDDWTYGRVPVEWQDPTGDAAMTLLDLEEAG